MKIDKEDVVVGNIIEGIDGEEIIVAIVGINKIGGLKDNKKQNRIYNGLKDFCDKAHFHVAECMWDQFEDSNYEDVVRDLSLFEED